MTTQLTPSKRHDRRADPLAQALEQQGLVDPLRHDEVVFAIDRALAGQDVRPATLRRRLVELAAYVGAAFVVAAAVLLATEQWPELGTGQRVGLLALVAAFLFVAGLSTALVGGRLSALREPSRDRRRRLASVLLTGAAAAAAASVMVWLIDDVVQAGDEAERGWQIGLGGSSTLLVLAVLGYVIAPSLLGQLAVAAGAIYFIPFVYEALGVADSVLYGTTYLVLGLGWLLLAELRVWHEQMPARVIGGAMALVGAQSHMELEWSWVAYALTLLVGMLGFGLYVVRRAWPYVALGVIGVTVAVPEALLDWTAGSVGTAGALLVAGGTLLGASLFGLRLHQEAAD